MERAAERELSLPHQLIASLKEIDLALFTPHLTFKLSEPAAARVRGAPTML
jgi:hypothetical protein